jgi:hypothetical protein
LDKSKEKQAYYYNRCAHDRPPLNIGDNVRIRDKPTDKHWRKGVITEQLPYRAYQVRLDDNTTRRRNNRHIRWSPTPPVMLPADETDDESSQPRKRPPTVDTTVNQSNSNKHSASATNERQQPHSILKTGSQTEGTYKTRYGRIIRRPKRYE